MLESKVETIRIERIKNQIVEIKAHTKRKLPEWAIGKPLLVKYYYPDSKQVCLTDLYENDSKFLRMKVKDLVFYTEEQFDKTIEETFGKGVNWRKENRLRNNRNSFRVPMSRLT